MEPAIQAIQNNLVEVQKTIAETCQRVNRNPEDVTLVAVSKQRTAEEVLTALQAGVTHLGENRVEEARDKIPVLNALLPEDLPEPTWHMIGHVQRRKVESVVQYFPVVHSLDSVKIARRYETFAGDRGTKINVLLQINVSGEESKEGFLADNWKNDPAQRHYLWTFVQELMTFSHLKINGLMTMAPFIDDEERLRTIFRRLRVLRDALAEEFLAIHWSELSMGMTNDYQIAIEEGATMVRIGRAIFGERPKG